MILYSAIFLNLLALRVFFCGFFRIFYMKDHTICKERLFVFLSNQDALYFFPLPNCSAQISSTMLRRNGKSHLCLAPNIMRKAFDLSALRMMFAMAVFHRCPSTPRLLSVRVCQMLSSASVEIIIYFSSSINMPSYIHWFS